MKKEGEPKLYHGIPNAFDLGEIALIATFNDEPDISDLLMPLTRTGLSPLGIELRFVDWSEVDLDQLNLSAPQYFFGHNAVTIFYNCGFHDPETAHDRKLGHMINYFAGGSGYMQTESGNYYREFNIHLLILLPVSQRRVFVRHFINRNPASIPFTDLLEEE